MRQPFPAAFLFLLTIIISPLCWGFQATPYGYKVASLEADSLNVTTELNIAGKAVTGDDPVFGISVSDVHATSAIANFLSPVDFILEVISVRPVLGDPAQYMISAGETNKQLLDLYVNTQYVVRACFTSSGQKCDSGYPFTTPLVQKVRQFDPLNGVRTGGVFPLGIVPDDHVFTLEFSTSLPSAASRSLVSATHYLSACVGTDNSIILATSAIKHYMYWRSVSKAVDTAVVPLIEDAPLHFVVQNNGTDGVVAYINGITAATWDTGYGPSDDLNTNLILGLGGDFDSSCTVGTDWAVTQQCPGCYMFGLRILPGLIPIERFTPHVLRPAEQSLGVTPSYETFFQDTSEMASFTAAAKFPLVDAPEFAPSVYN